MHKSSTYKVFTLVLALMLAFAVTVVVAGCGGDEGEEETITTEAETETETTEGEETEETEATEDGEAEQITLKYAFFAPANTFPAVQMEEWAKEVEARTDGQVTVETFPGGTLLSAGNMYDGVLEGVADIGLSCPTYEPGRFPLLSLNDLPGLYPDSKVASITFYDLIQEFEPEELSDYKVITAFATEPRYFQTIEPADSLEDLSGITVRTAGGPPYEQMLGAAMESMPMSELGQALQTGVVDGFTSSREVLMDLKFAETTKYWTDYRLGVVSFLALMDRERWEELPPNVQEVIDELGSEMSLFAGEYLDEHVEESIQWSEENHELERVELSEEEAARWDEALAPLEEEYSADVTAQGLPADDFLERLREIEAENREQYQ